MEGRFLSRAFFAPKVGSLYNQVSDRSINSSIFIEISDHVLHFHFYIFWGSETKMATVRAIWK